MESRRCPAVCALIAGREPISRPTGGRYSGIGERNGSQITESRTVTRQRRPRLVDVAERAGVSKSLVSQVVRGDGSVSEKNTKRILEAIVELGYTPNALAQGLVRRRSGVFGIVVPDLHNPVFPEIIDGVIDAVNEAGFTTLIASVGPNERQPLAGLDALISYQAEAILLAGVPLDNKRIETVAAMVPVVNIASPTPDDTRMLSVTTEDVSGIKAAIEELISLGHRDIALVYQTEDRSGQDRLAAYRDVMAGNGLEAKAFSEEPGPRPGQVATTELLAHARSFTAILAVNDNTAIGVLGVLRNHGVEVPGSVSVIGFDDIVMASNPLIDLTTIRQPRFEMGRAAARLAIDVIESGDQEVADRNLVYQPELVRRGSTGPAPR